MRHALSKGMLVTAAAASGILSLNGSPAFAASADSAATNSPGILSGNNVQASVDVPVNVCGNSVNVAGVGNPAFANGCANDGNGANGGNGARAGSGDNGGTRPSGPGRESGRDDGRAAAPERAAPKHAAPRHAARSASGPASGPESPSGHPETREYRGRHAAPRQQERAPRAYAPHAGHPGGSAARGAAVGSPGVLSGNLLQAPVDVPVNLCGNTVDVIALLNPVFGNACANAPKPRPPHHHAPHHATPHHPAPRPSAPRGPAPQEGEDGDFSWFAHFGSEEGPAARTAARTPSRAVAAPPRLAETGAGAGVLLAGAASAALLTGGAILYRRGSRTTRR
ncbi:chaplin family protein [Streptomyces sp. NPDC007088]|uniref:chaplin family protein n=1 Tax=Streptomyces sp. NPDC007088 TaxID=3364773 RepID=UPI0036CCB566